MWRLVVLGAAVVALFSGCGGGSDEPTQLLAGGTFEEELGLTLVIGDVEVGGDETRAPVTIRNAGAYKIVLEPHSSTLVVDGERHLLDRSEFPLLIPYAGAGGGATSGTLVFPRVAADADSYVLRLQGTSENTTIGDDGSVGWNVILVPRSSRVDVSAEREAG